MKEIPLTRGYVALVDTADFKKFGGLKWYAAVKHSGKVYAARKKAYGPMTYLHSLICPAPKGGVTDHKNGNSLDCRRGNLVGVPHGHNVHNRGKMGKTSRYIGVCWDAGKHRWRASIQYRGKRLFYLFRSEQKAARCRDRWAIALYGRGHARLNFPRSYK